MSSLELTDCRVSLLERKVYWQDEVRTLTPTEAELLAYLVAHPLQEISREELYREVWGHHSVTRSRTVDTTIYNLRAKLEADPANPSHIFTVPRRGFRFVPHTVVALGNDHRAQEGFKRPDLRPIARPMLVGRTVEQQQLRACWQTAAAGRPQLVAIVGEAGIGKTRLGEDLLAWARERQVNTAAAACYAMEGRLGYDPIISLVRGCAPKDLPAVWQRELARWMPGLMSHALETPATEPPTQPWQRQRLFEALARAVLSRQPLMVLIDDLQWCDRDSLEWLHFLLRFQPDARLLVVTAIRSEDLLPSHPVSNFLATLQYEQRAIRLTLPCLDLQATSELATSLSSHQLSPELKERLYHETQGHPLFVVEMVQAGFLSGDQQRTVTLPATLAATLELRFSHVAVEAGPVVELVAVNGGSASLDLLAQATGMAQAELLSVLAELQVHRILKETSPDVFEFTHLRLAEFVCGRIPSSAQRRSHLQLAVALERAVGRGRETLCGQLALHFEAAGLPERAIPFYIKAAEAARRLAANSEALSLYGKAHYLLETRLDPELSWQALFGRHQLYVLNGSKEQTTANLSAMERLAVAHHQNAWLASVRCEEALMAYRRGEGTTAMVLAAEALSLARMEGAIDLEVRALFGGALARAAAGRELDQALDDMKAALTLIRGHALPGEGQILGGLAYLYLIRSELDQAETTVDELARLARQQGDRELEASAMLRRGEVLVDADRFEEALEALERALQLSQDLQHRVKEIVTRIGLSVVQIHLRRFDAARASLHCGVKLSLQLGLAWEEAVCRLNQAWIHCRLGQWERAREGIEQGLELTRKAGLSNRQPELLARYAELEVESGRPEIALQYTQQGLALEAVAQEPEMHTILLLIQAKAYRSQGAAQQAIALLTGLVNVRIRSYATWTREVTLDVRQTLADLYLSENLPERAYACLEPVVSALDANLALSPTPQLAYFLYSRICLALGDKAGAQKALRRARELLLETAGQLQAASDRQSYLENIPTHREILSRALPE